MPDLCPKDIDLGVKPSAPSCPPTLPPNPGLQTEHTESLGTTPHPERVALVSVKTQTEIQTAQVKVQTTPVSVRPQTIKVRETQTIEVEKLRQQKLRVKYLGMRWRTGDKEIKKSRFLQSIPGIVCAERPERLRNSHISCCLFMKHPPGEIISP